MVLVLIALGLGVNAPIARAATDPTSNFYCSEMPLQPMPSLFESSMKSCKDATGNLVPQTSTKPTCVESAGCIYITDTLKKDIVDYLNEVRMATNQIVGPDQQLPLLKSFAEIKDRYELGKYFNLHKADYEPTTLICDSNDPKMGKAPTCPGPDKCKKDILYRQTVGVVEFDKETKDQLIRDENRRQDGWTQFPEPPKDPEPAAPGVPAK